MFRKSKISVDLIDFSGMHVATGQVGSYIKHLYEEHDFQHIGYRYKNINGDLRFILYTVPNNKLAVQYFKDRCPAMVENECRSCEGIPHKFVKWENGFEEVQ